jgi:hypothetical protein
MLKGTEESDNPYKVDNVSIARELDFPNMQIFELADQLGTTDASGDCI